MMNWLLSLNPVHRICLFLCALLLAMYAVMGVVLSIKFIVRFIKAWKEIRRMNIEFDEDWMDFDKWKETEE